jgi:hypothetical protein
MLLSHESSHLPTGENVRQPTTARVMIPAGKDDEEEHIVAAS